MNKPSPLKVYWKNRRYYWKRLWGRLTNTPQMEVYHQPMPERYYTVCPACDELNTYKTAYCDQYTTRDMLSHSLFHGATRIRMFEFPCAGCGYTFPEWEDELPTRQYTPDIHIIG